VSVALQVAIAFGSVGVLLGLMALVRLAARQRHINPEVSRKLIHVATGLYALILHWLFPDRWPVYMLIGVTLVAMIILRLPALSGGLGQTLHAVERRSYGDFLLATAVGLCFFLSGGEALLYILPIAVLTLADAAAALAGTTYGRQRFTVEAGQKSVEGTVVFFTVTLLIALICLMFLSDLPPANILALALMVAAFGALVEAQSWRGFDNLFLPLGLLVFLAIHSKSDLSDLLTLAGLFFVTIVGFRAIGPRFGLTRHSARVHVVAMFLILAVTEVQNAILPAMVLVTHAWASLRNRGDDDYGDLDIIAGLGLFSFGWLALGLAMGPVAVQFYGLTAMGLAMGLATLALRGRLILVPLIASLLFALREATTALNPPSALWAEPLWPLALVCLAVTAGPAIAAPRLFAGDRVLKLTILAILPPLATYLALVLTGAGPIPSSGPTG
jgi:dolichol kinase